MNRIVEAMHRLRDAGNTLVVVEHDPAVMLAADRLIDMGPGPGERGGADRLRRHARGDPQRRHADRRLPRRAQAGRHGPEAPGRASRRRGSSSKARATTTCKNVTVEFPLQRLVCVTGVSGSGKTTLMQDVLAPGAGAPLRQGDRDAGRARRAARRRPAERRGVRRPDRRSARPRARIRRATSARSTRSASSSPTRRWRVQRGYGAGMFSFNAGDGRCPTCGGSGFEHVEMQFLSRRLPALPRLRRPALPRRDPRREDRARRAGARI